MKQKPNKLVARGLLWVAWKKDRKDTELLEGQRVCKCVWLYCSADAVRTRASWIAASARRGFQGIILCNDTLNLCAAQHSELQIREGQSQWSGFRMWCVRSNACVVFQGIQFLIHFVTPAFVNLTLMRHHLRVLRVKRGLGQLRALCINTHMQTPLNTDHP